MAQNTKADDSTEAKIADLYAGTPGTEIEVTTETGSVEATVTGTDVENLDAEGNVVRRIVCVEFDDGRDAKITLDDDGHGRFSPTLEYETSEEWKTHTTCEIINDIRRRDANDEPQGELVADGGTDEPGRVMAGGMNEFDRDSDGFRFGLRVERDGDLTHVPIVDVTRSVYTEYTGDVPARVEFDRVYMYEGRLTAEAWYDDGSMVEMHETEPGSEEWKAAYHENPSSVDPADYEVWRRPGKERDELGLLVERGLSPAEALDYWAVEMQGSTATNWAEKRGRTHQAVSENVRKARDKL